MSAETTASRTDKSLGSRIDEEISILVQKCYQCGKCSAGCPLNEEMDYPPSLVLRMLQYREPGMDKKVLKSYSIWLCLACEMCYQRCPMEIDIPSVMDFLRAESRINNLVNKKAKQIIAFHHSFLNSIERTGRLHEMGVIMEYKMRTFNLMQDVTRTPELITRGKFHLLPEKIRDTASMKKIFKKTINK
jgi:heterodisulfide reductase subunit C